jgi:hypothetical protein
MNVCVAIRVEQSNFNAGSIAIQSLGIQFSYIYSVGQLTEQKQAGNE